MTYALEAKNLSLMWHDMCVIEDVQLKLKIGHIASILGKSGTGKTTLFQALAGLTSPHAGKVFVGGEETTAQPGHVGYMQQDDLLLPTKTIQDNASLPLQIQGISQSKARSKAAKELEAFGLEGTKTLYPRQLSGGMRQRVAFLRTYLAAQPVILADEPFSALDAITRREMQEWFVDMLQNHHLSALCITHDIEEALIISDEIYILQGDPMKGVPSHLLPPMVIERENLDRTNYILSETALEVKKEIWKQLEKKG